MQPDQGTMNRWGTAAPFWEKYREPIRAMFAPVSEALIEDAAIRSGHAVLDVATGPGEPALTVAAVVGPKGRVAGVDPVPAMVAAASRGAEQMGFGNAHFEIASATPLPFADASFDAVVCRFGAMFFPDPLGGVREMLRVLRPGGKLALAVWGAAERNPFFSALQDVMDRHAGSSAVESQAADQFRFASPGTLRDILADAGAMAPSERLLAFRIEAPMSVEAFWTLRCEMSEKLREKVATLSEEQLAEVKHEALEALSAYSAGGGMNFPGEVLIVSGTAMG